MENEYRTYAGEELRVDRAENTAPVIRMSLKFNSLSVPLGFFMRFREKIAPDAFDSVLNDESREVMAYWGHDVNKPLGRRSRGTLRLTKTETLLKAEIDAPDTTWGRDAIPLSSAAMLRGCRSASWSCRKASDGMRTKTKILSAR